MEKNIEVGGHISKMVTPENNELYKVAKDMFRNETEDAWHMGWINVSKFIDYIEEVYGLEKLVKDK